MFKVITPVSTEPVTTAEVKLHLRLTSDTTEDSLITNLITSAREYCENYTGRALATQTIEMLLDSFSSSSIELPMPPLQSITSVKYKDSDGAETTMDAADYIVDTDSDVGRIVLPYGSSWPSFVPYPANPIRIRYVGGYTTAPKTIKQAMLLLIGYWYANRDMIGSVDPDTAFAVKALLSQYRVRWLG